ncbi:MAG TPA: phosphoglucosamine mutase [Pseudomonas sabulinigri]|jgi:phosphoglucosamine mutase|uniref:Phosphoglucosamine mutase n=1 Tax=marine sediment metagenome TaxID=412755 RepID=A0A0F9TVU6_9ZZZZ|nr:phosphoglucosamine mutase [Halopseudomonas sabulinigri]HEC51446.1 phosphoglucosamine mutase [Halopseudomonas sabulinigri]|tara:strand:- start:1416 stop:2759 length:1344 start_codon:yes stop_codon:yes gene_type:complete
MEKRYFGTDGIRGRVGSSPITPEFMLKLGWAVGMAFKRQGACRVLIGKDTRISGYMFESALEAGLSAAGAQVQLLGPMPTPAIAYLTRTFMADAGIVISASHNPYYDNGIKFFSGDGSKLPDSLELEIEALVDAPMQVVESADLGKVARVEDASGRYIEFCKSSVPTSTSFKGMKVVLDCAHGATYKVAPSVFRELGAEVHVIGAQPDGLNINSGFGSTDLKALKAEVLQRKADIGIAFDGDGDRVMMVDHEGCEVDGDELLYIIAVELQQRGLLQGGVVGTLMSNLGLQLALEKLDVPFVRANVGDRYVMAELRARGWIVGGEASGHLVCLHHTSTGDGIIAALQVLKALQRSGQTLFEARQGMFKCPQKLINVRYTPSAISPVEDASVLAAVAESEARMGEAGRVLLRLSGTEPLVRVMVEGQDAALVEQEAAYLAEVVAQVFAE